MMSYFYESINHRIQRSIRTSSIENKPKNIDLILSSRDTFDLTSKKECDFYIKIKPDLILNAAAYTAVDKAESEEDLIK